MAYGASSSSGNGMSAFGGFFGALVGLSFHFRRRRRSWLVEADILVQALVVGWIFGRLGCTLVHDHVGVRSSFPLAIHLAHPDARYLGLTPAQYACIALAAIGIRLARRVSDSQPAAPDQSSARSVS
jgi:prolipoprotein diacylglyceryltransferase